MTDKQIIIHGVDVSGCNRLNTFPMQYGEPHEICLTSLEQWGGQEKYCKDRPNCYYKQLKRSEAQCEAMFVTHTDLEKKYKAKEQECEELKKQLMQKSEVDMFFNTPIEGWSNDPCGICRYKQTLTEIKPILEYYANSTIGEEQEDGTYRIELSYKYGSSNM